MLYLSGHSLGFGGEGAEMGQLEPVCFGCFIESSGRLEPPYSVHSHTSRSSEAGAAMDIADGQAIPILEKQRTCFESPF